MNARMRVSALGLAGLALLGTAVLLRAEQDRQPERPIAVSAPPQSSIVDSPIRPEISTPPSAPVVSFPPVALRGGEHGTASSAVLSGGIPDIALAAYRQAADRLARTAPRCGLSWTVVAAIGRLESNHGRYGGARLYSDGTALPPIRGLALNGADGVATVPDSDGGRYDQDGAFDRAVGPMQFIPSTWRAYAADGNGDGRADPDNIFDAALAAGRYLCTGGVDLRDPARLRAAVFRYNHSESYVDMVLSVAAGYDAGIVPVIAAPVVLPPPSPPPSPAPAPVSTTTPSPAPPSPRPATTTSSPTTTTTPSPTTTSGSTTSGSTTVSSETSTRVMNTPSHPVSSS